MFKAVISNPDLFKESLSVISSIIDEGVFKVDSNGVSLLSPDRNVIVVVDFKLLSTAFDEFFVDNETSLGLNLGNLMGILKRVKSSDKLTLKSSGNKLELHVEGNSKRKFDLPLLDIKSENPPIDQLNFSGKADIESYILEEGVEDAGVVSDSIVFQVSPENFKLLAKGDISTAELELKKGHESLLNLESQEVIKSRYPLDYLKKISKACKLSKQVSLEFGNNYPMKLSFKEMDKMNLNFILAPRVSDDD